MYLLNAIVYKIDYILQAQSVLRPSDSLSKSLPHSYNLTVND